MTKKIKYHHLCTDRRIYAKSLFFNQGSEDFSKGQVNTMLTEMVASLGKHLKKGSRIRISGLGILQVRKRPARMGRNPATGEAIKIKAGKKIAFPASKDLKEAVM